MKLSAEIAAAVGAVLCTTACFSIWTAIWQPKLLKHRWIQTRWFGSGKPASRWATLSGSMFVLCIGLAMVNAYAQFAGPELLWILVAVGGLGLIGALIIDLE